MKKKFSSNSPQPLSSSSSSSSSPHHRPLLGASSSSSSISIDQPEQKSSKQRQSVGFGQSVQVGDNAIRVFLYFQTQCANQTKQEKCEKVTVEHEIGLGKTPFTMTCKWDGISCSPSDETKQFFGQPLSPSSSPLFESEIFSQSSFYVNPSAGNKSTPSAQLGYNGNQKVTNFPTICGNQTTQNKCEGVTVDDQNEHGTVLFTMECEWDDGSKSCSPSKATKEYLKISK
ncbi:hypothetical protein niasHS_009671 [Heterodera schachtii]|uniref:Uncharacterized protein n=1 Tax=Heterodera schachtii TaxID=97005 RepID=A0ABD2J4Y8_HETSC